VSRGLAVLLAAGAGCLVGIQAPINSRLGRSVGSVQAASVSFMVGTAVLLLAAMKESNVAALGRFVLAGKEKLCLIRPLGDALALETLFVAEDVKSQDEIDEAVSATAVKKEELQLAQQLIGGLEGSFDPSELKSEYRASLRELLEAKAEGFELPAAEPEAADAPVIDLMEALRASVEAAGKAGKGKEKPAATRKRAAAGK